MVEKRKRTPEKTKSAEPKIKRRKRTKEPVKSKIAEPIAGKV